jgi:hypothetical protein
MKNYQKMSEKLFDSLMDDLSNPEARSPQLYKVVLDVLKENRDSIEITDRNVDQLIEEKVDLPFKFGT